MGTTTVGAHCAHGETTSNMARHRRPNAPWSSPARRVAHAGAHAGDCRLNEDHTPVVVQGQPRRHRRRYRETRLCCSSQHGRCHDGYAIVLPGPPRTPPAPSPHQRTTPPRSTAERCRRACPTDSTAHFWWSTVSKHAARSYPTVKWLCEFSSARWYGAPNPVSAGLDNAKFDLFSNVRAVGLHCARTSDTTDA